MRLDLHDVRLTAPQLDNPAGMLARHNSTVSPPLNDWMRESDFHASLVHINLNSLPGQGHSTRAASQYRSASVLSSLSMAPMSLHYNDSLHPPSLVHSNPDSNTETTPTESSVTTGLASHLRSGVPLLEENNGVLERREVPGWAPQYHCVFWFLSCDHLFSDEDTWKTHCLSHFRGEEPPKSVRCPLCDWTTHHENGETAWGLRMTHLAGSHLLIGETFRTSRPDFHLFQHLWQKYLIDDQELKELKGGNHNLAYRLSNFAETNGREVRRQRDGRRPREDRGQRLQYLTR